MRYMAGDNKVGFEKFWWTSVSSVLPCDLSDNMMYQEGEPKGEVLSFVPTPFTLGL